MAQAPNIVRTVAALRAQVREWRASQLSIAMVPTMGALHEGHLSLCRLALEQADRLVVSIFVNPKQFAPTEDLSAYPRPFEADVAKLQSIGTHTVFAPAVDEIYPVNFSTLVHVGGVSEGLCAVARPPHFDGVSTVVTKLLLQCLPDVAVFGEKDYQQLQVIKRLVRDLDIPVEIIPGPTVREPDGLAMSSRNAYLTHNERGVAPMLYRVLQLLADAIKGGAIIELVIDQGIAALKSAGFDPIEYLELRDAEMLEPLTKLDRPARLLVAARLGKTRLIDNIAVNPD
ncbi:MAG: pantoate--beta-alanine ligase [Alphaproteobacteria bacterium]